MADSWSRARVRMGPKIPDPDLEHSLEPANSGFVPHLGRNAISDAFVYQDDEDLVEQEE